jgi:putative ABC transport system substrate-binding protein
MQRRTFIGGSAAILAARSCFRDTVADQPTKLPVIGFLGGTSPGPNAATVAAFHQGLAETGYIEGKNVAIEFRWAEGYYDRSPTLAADLVGRKVNVILTSGGTPPARAAKNATSAIPIVFATADDPVEAGLVASFSRPGANLTGVSIMGAEMMAKRLELLSEVVPQARVIALLVNPNNKAAEPKIRDVEEAAHQKGLQLHVLEAGDEGEIDTAFDSLVQRQAGALVVGADPFFNTRREQLVALAARHAVPAIYQVREFVAAGGLISYGGSIPSLYRLAGSYVGRILAGAKPADLPVQQPTKFELIVNLKTASALGLTVPPSILTRADEVIE